MDFYELRQQAASDLADAHYGLRKAETDCTRATIRDKALEWLVGGGHSDSAVPLARAKADGPVVSWGRTLASVAQGDKAVLALFWGLGVVAVAQRDTDLFERYRLAALSELKVTHPHATAQRLPASSCYAVGTADWLLHWEADRFADSVASVKALVRDGAVAWVRTAENRNLRRRRAEAIEVQLLVRDLERKVGAESPEETLPMSATANDSRLLAWWWEYAPGADIHPRAVVADRMQSADRLVCTVMPGQAGVLMRDHLTQRRQMVR